MKAMEPAKCRIALGSITHAMKAEELPENQRADARRIPAPILALVIRPGACRPRPR